MVEAGYLRPTGDVFGMGPGDWGCDSPSEYPPELDFAAARSIAVEEIQRRRESPPERKGD